MAVKGINHVALRVRNLEESRRFFELLGFEESGRQKGMLFFAAGGHHHHIALLDAGKDAALPPRGATGIMHFAVTVEDEADLTRLHRVLGEAGFKILRSIDHIVSRSFYVEDSNGIVVEVTYDVDEGQWAQYDNPFGRDKPYEIGGKDSA